MMKKDQPRNALFSSIAGFSSCDTVVATGDVTADGVTLFAKNSDREPNEAQQVLYVPSADHPPHSHVRCTYIQVPQVSHTFAVLLARPFWMWGAEMGVNEHGLAIGNEAVFTRVPYEKKGGLTGMDLLRLALERARTASEAVSVITDLLDRYGQGGNCGFQHKLYYHNSFLMADPQEAWVLETAGPHWAAKKVTGVYTISNGLTIGTDWDLASPDLVRHAVQKGWCRHEKEFDFARCYSDFLYTKFSDCRRRRKRSMALLSDQQKNINVQSLANLLRDHGQEADENWRPDRGLTGATICMHAGFGPVRVSQTTGSLICHLHPQHRTHFYTGTAAPCTGIFKPIWLDTALPPMGPPPTGTYDPSTLFWRHEELHRSVLRDYSHRIRIFQAERNALEEQFIERALELSAKDAAIRSAFARKCFDEANNAETQWLKAVKAAGVETGCSPLYKLAWSAFNRKARMPT